MSEQTNSRREPDDPMARQSGAVLEDVQPVETSDRPGETAQDGSSEEALAAPTDPGEPPAEGA
jgi:hypothetical protein